MANIFLKNDGDFELARVELANKVTEEDARFFLQHHYLRIENIYDFLHSEEKIMALCGFQASGKTKTIECALKFLPENVCTITLDCAYSVCLDDIMLFVYNKLKKFCEQRKIVLKKPSSPDFKEVLKECLQQLKMPIVIVLNSFEHCLRDENKEQSAAFLKFLQSFPNIKVILSARQLNEKDEVFEGIKISKYISKALEYDAMVELFKQNNFDLKEDAAQKIYEYSRGYYGYEVMLVNILRAFSLTPEGFLAEHESRNMPYDNFLIDKLLTLVSDNVRNILEFLCILRINFPAKTIYSLNFATSEEIEYLQKKNLICVFDGNIYVKDFVKELVLAETKTYTKFKIHKFLADFFESQLPLKPKERAVELSRQTMREEIKFHTHFIKANTLSEKPSQSRLPQTVANMSYISYSRGLKDHLSPNMTEMMENTNFDKSKIIEGSDGTLFEFDSPAAVSSLKNLDIKEMKERAKKKLLQQKAEPPEKEVNTPQETQIQEETKKQNETIENILVKADEYSRKEEYRKANELYEEVVYKIKDTALQAEVFEKTGKNYKKTNDYISAIDFLERAFDLKEKNGNKKDLAELLLNIADLYKDTYKNTKAQNLYYQLLAEYELSDIYLIKCYLGLSDLENSQQNPNIVADYFRKIFDKMDKIDDKSLRAEVYFKYALFKDDENKIDDALKYYNLSVETAPEFENNIFLSSCFSNIASIYEEKGKKDLAHKNLQKALELDKRNNNLEGIYYCNSSLANLLQNQDKKAAKNYYILAIKYAKLLNDDFYVASSHMNYGDFLSKTGENKAAIKQYLIAKKHINKETADDNLRMIDFRLNDLKIKMGKDSYFDAIREIRNNEQ